MLKVCDEISEIEIDFNEPIKVDFQGEFRNENRELTPYYRVNDYVLAADQLHKLVAEKRDAIWHFGFDSLRIFLSEIEDVKPTREAARLVCDFD